MKDYMTTTFLSPPSLLVSFSLFRVSKSHWFKFYIENSHWLSERLSFLKALATVKPSILMWILHIFQIRIKPHHLILCSIVIGGTKY